MNAMCWNRAVEGKRSWASSVLVLWMVFVASCVFAQAPAASSYAAPAMSAAELDKLVGPIALYPDDLIAIILPAATYPLEIVQADRYLDKRKKDKNLPVNDAWQDSVKSLLNYPEVVKKMSEDLDWTTDLGEAVVADQGAVLEAIQSFRRQVQGVGNLKSDDKQTVIVEKEVIQVVQANPEVIYVPQYNPSTIVVAGGYPSYGYYPAPYPVYYYPYAPGAALATGLIWGAAMGAAWNGGRYAAHYGYGGGYNNINVNRTTNISTSNINRGSAQGTAWKSDKKPGQVSSGAGRPANAGRVGDRPGAGAGGPGAGNRPGAGVGDRPGAGAGAGDRPGAGGGARPSTLPASRPSAGLNDRGGASAGDRSAQNRGGDAFGGHGSGRDARADSSRGAASRASMSSSGRGQSFQGGGGGSRQSFQGGGGGGRSSMSGGGGGGRAGGGGGGRGGGGGGGRR